MNFNYMADLKYARVIARKASLGLVMKPGLKQPYTDFSSIYLPELSPEWDRTDARYIFWWYALIHECYHNLHPDDFVKLKQEEVQMGSFLGTVWNVVMDFKIETVNRGEFLGRDRHVQSARYAFAADKIYGAFAQCSDAGGTADKLQAAWVFDALCRIPWIPAYADDDLADLLSREGKEYLEILLKDPNLFDDYSDQTTALHTYRVACRILELLGDDPNAQENREPPKIEFGAPDSAEGSGDEPSEGGSEGEGDGDGDASGEASGGVDSESGETGEGKEGQRQVDGWVKFSEIISDDHDRESGTSNAGLEIEYDLDVNRSYQWTPKNMNVRNLDRVDTANHEMIQKHDKLSSMFAHCHLTKKIRRELQAKLQQKWLTGQKRGRIHKRALHKVPKGGDKIFRKKTTKINTKGMAVGILCDFSGSMGGEKYLHACTATHELARVCSALQINTGVYGFNTSYGTDNYILPLKPFRESFRSDVFLERCVAASKSMGCNADGDFLLWMGGELMKQKATRRVLFVISDGQPAATDNHGNSDIDAFTSSVVRNMLQSRQFEIYGIGVKSKAVEHFYPDRCVIDDPKQLEDRLLHVLRNKVINYM